MRGISGWLILVAIAMCVNPLRLTASLIQLVHAFDPAWRAFTTPDTPAYHWLGAPLLIAEVFSSIVLLGWSVFLTYLFFSKKQSFPGSMIAFMSVSVIVVTVDLLLAMMIAALRQVDQTGEELALIQLVVSAAIWILYFKKSKRAHATFVE